MTDKLHCPFCGSELAPHIDEWKSIRKLFICNNTGCFCWGQPMLLEIWQALIVGKKAQNSLIRIGKILLLDGGKPSVLTVKDKQEIKRIITSITKQENE